MAFSPVANLLAATASAGSVTLFGLDTGGASRLWQAPEGGPNAIRDLAFSRDGTRAIVYAGGNPSRGDEVWVFKVPSAEIESRHSTDYSDTYHHGAARLSPDGQRLYLAPSEARDYQYRIQCLDLAHGRELWQTGHGPGHRHVHAGRPDRPACSSVVAASLRLEAAY